MRFFTVCEDMQYVSESDLLLQHSNFPIPLPYSAHAGILPYAHVPVLPHPCSVFDVISRFPSVSKCHVLIPICRLTRHSRRSGSPYRTQTDTVCPGRAANAAGRVADEASRCAVIVTRQVSVVGFIPQSSASSCQSVDLMFVVSRQLDAGSRLSSAVCCLWSSSVKS